MPYIVNTLANILQFPMSSRDQYNPVSMPINITRPVDLPSYSRSMHQHTQRQMEAASRSLHRRGNRCNNSHISKMSATGSTSSSGSSVNNDYHD
ncbi:uncharacterized protein BCR38DRAFT_417690 [Pseudomassariella vexata]|uniref:Uncharacterized protein n=1 Tax=Pseudomassariella vexata TaxID=1141098 RepID=A0A1Y2ELC5_9PEZI|nr:uncharacterized protein BCR38DRAFT_417690 [Pseudomassariella vexata]ORY71665.1 hypothetical protein BCR38DRAFT_417690 [Pseudomassariella vexata]